ncbi:uncharacterized protein LOC119091144 [Pollicipes pollicipes]|uniref:uncharacterized protein LOC119091144 n=1 Tax=Pollicipes pollicipes TaxID=41117 RepID=UPI0018858684|nr:uncharacterized protein LOC119091144 [Pollicipes pollicipes]
MILQWTLAVSAATLTVLATADGFFFPEANTRPWRRGSSNRSYWASPSYWDSPSYGYPSHGRYSYGHYPSHSRYSYDRYPSHGRPTYLPSSDQQPSHGRPTYLPSSDQQPSRHSGPWPQRVSSSRRAQLGRRVIDVGAEVSSNRVTTTKPAPAPAAVTTDSTQNYVKNTELLVKIATHFDKKGCFRRLVCECEYYDDDSASRTLEEKLILHVFGMKRRNSGHVTETRYLEAAAIGEAARQSGKPDPCAPLAPKCKQNMVLKLRARKNKQR